MRIQYVSDLHLEFEKNSKLISSQPLRVSGEILLLAGDILPLHDEYFSNYFLRYITDHYQKVFWVPGNHEYYHKDLKDFNRSFTINLNNTISIVNNIDLVYENIHFIFSTLWSKIRPENETLIEHEVADFDCIFKNNKKLKAKDFNNLHENSLNFIHQSLNCLDSRPTVVVTHHLPSLLCNSTLHNDSPINEAFCVDLSNLIEKSNVNFWVYGHSHYNQKPLFLGNTILLTNQMGYVHFNEQKGFKRDSYFSV